MANLAIKGHATRGREVIELLEMLGGINKHQITAIRETYVYFVDEDEIIRLLKINQLLPEQFIVFTLEEFFEKYPYKVGDKVKDAIIEDYVGTIIEAQWDNYKKEMVYTVTWDNMKELTYFARDLQPYKEETMEEKRIPPYMDYDVKAEETMEEKLEQIILEIPAGYEFFGINDDNKVVLTKKQLKHPQTYKECCETLNVINTEIPYIILSQLGKPITSLAKLIVCRDAYWKIAGEQMGLNEPWKPDFDKENEYKYGLFRLRNIIYKDATCINPTLLIFPTSEMRDAFYENFKELIDACKEFL